MAKVAFSKLKCKINEEIKTISFNGEDIEVLQYLPIQEKLGLISRVIMQAHEEDANYSNPVKIKIFTDLEILYAYTNITFTEKQKENFPKLYDIVYSSGLLTKIKQAIPDCEYDLILNGVFDSLKAVYDYAHSTLGILQTITQDYKDQKLNIEELKNLLIDISGSENFKELTSILDLN